MKITPLTSRQMTGWSRWLQKSYGQRQLRDHTIYRCHIDYTMYLTPWTSLKGFALRQVTLVSYSTAHADTSGIPYQWDSINVSEVQASAQEGNILNNYFNLSDSASSIHLLHKAEAAGHADLRFDLFLDPRLLDLAG